MNQISIQDASDLERTLRQSMAHADSLLGEILLGNGALTAVQLQEALDTQKNLSNISTLASYWLSSVLPARKT